MAGGTRNKERIQGTFCSRGHFCSAPFLPPLSSLTRSGKVRFHSFCFRGSGRHLEREKEASLKENSSVNYRLMDARAGSSVRPAPCSPGREQSEAPWPLRRPPMPPEEKTTTTVAGTSDNLFNAPVSFSRNGHSFLFLSFKCSF